jgi:hypothetical protein
MRKKVTKKKGPSTDSESTEYETSSDGEVYIKEKTRKNTAPQRNVRGCGAPIPQGRGSTTAGSSSGHPRMKQASICHPTDEYDDNIDLSYLETMVLSIMRPTRGPHDPSMVNYKRGGNSISTLQYSEDPRYVERSFFGDIHFWFPHQANWYESVIMTKKHVTTEMRWIDWDHLKRLSSPVKEVVDAIYDRCNEMDLVEIMSFRCDWNEEVVAQFYATLFVEQDERTIHWSIGGKRFRYNMAQFSILFGHTGDSMVYGGGYIVGRDTSKVDLHEILCMGKSRGSLRTTRCSTLSLGSLSLLEVVTQIKYPPEPRTF